MNLHNKGDGRQMEPTGRHADLDIGAAFSAGWSRFWPNILPMGLYALLVAAVNALFQVPQDAATGTTLVAGLVGLVIGQLVGIGWVAITLDITDGRRVTANGVTARFRLFLPYAIAAVLYSVMVMVGLMLLVVPGIILAIIFAFYGFHIIDTGSTDPIGALRRSAEITKGHRGKLFVFGVVLVLFNILGLMLFLIGVVFTSGISLLAVAHVYRQLAPAAGTDLADVE
jgi:hypothetical protein